MPNEFEKQVQKKMGELNLTPSVPVWENIEKQIRKKKDRRMVLWLPILFLLIGGGIWWFNSGSGKEPTTTQVQTDKQLTELQNTIQTNNPKETNKKKINKADATSQEQEDQNLNQETVNKEDNKISQTQSASFSSNSFSSTKRNKTNHSVVKAEIATRKFKSSVVKGRKVYNLPDIKNETVASHLKKSNETPAADNNLIEQVQVNSDSISSLAVNKNQTSTQNSELKKDSITADVLVPSNTPKKGSSKWTFGLMASAGSSGIGDGLKLFPHAEAMYSYSPNPSSNGSGYIPYPSTANNNLSFSIGLSVKKQLNKRFAFLTGLHYNYYSTTVNVGQKVTQDTLLGYTFVSQYYRNSGYSNSDTSDKYNNEFHFISVPVYIDFQVFQRVPLRLVTGLSIQQLIYTNALMYDISSGVYYQDKSDYKKTQLFYDLGINYSILKNRSLSIGPWMHYGLSQMEKNNTNQHLFSFGIGVQYFFLKK